MYKWPNDKSAREELTRALFERQSPSSRNKSNPKVQIVLSGETIRLAWSSNLSVGCINC